MADQPDQPEPLAAKKVPAKKAAAKKAPAKKAAAPKAPAKKAAAKVSPADTTPGKPASPLQPALERPVEVPALKPAPRQAALTAGANPGPEAAARDIAASAKETVRQAGAAASGPAPAASDYGLRLPMTIGLAAVSFIALLLRRLRRG